MKLSKHLVVLSVLAVAGCSGGDGSGGAMALAVGEPAMGTHGPADPERDPDSLDFEHDVYELGVPSAGDYRIEVNADDGITVAQCETPEPCFCIPDATCCTVLDGAGSCAFVLEGLEAGAIFLVTHNGEPAEASYEFTVSEY